jgi:hypothetical protein
LPVGHEILNRDRGSSYNSPGKHHIDEVKSLMKKQRRNAEAGFKGKHTKTVNALMVNENDFNEKG